MMCTSYLPLLAITMGDPAGIGPEITVSACARDEILEICRPIIIGQPSIIEKAAKLKGVPLHINVITTPMEYDASALNVIKPIALENLSILPGVVQADAGNAAYLSVCTAIDLAKDNLVDGTVTAPLNKEALNLAGVHEAGHTEIYAKRTNTKDYTMMLADGALRVAHVSTHVSLRVACDRVKKQRVERVIMLLYEAITAMNIPNPVIGVAGLNPHAGENGLFGREELDEIIPAINAARECGMRVEGPLPPDTAFSKALGGMYDGIVAMYHDQGHIPVKTVGFTLNPQTGTWNAVKGVNITLGLPIIRTSVDHGTAFDQAWKGTATDQSMVEAIRWAVILAGKRKV